jgi:DNA primase
MHNSLKDNVLESSDIVEVIGESVSLKRKGREYVGLCPFHDDHRPSLSVSPQKQIFKCWSCGAGGDVLRFVQLFHHVEFKEALAMLARRAGIETRPFSSAGPSSVDRERLRQALNWARSYFQRSLRQTEGGKRATEYAHRRGLTDATIQRFGLGYAADAWDALLVAAGKTGIPRDILQQAGLVSTNESGKSYDRFRDRLIFPICDALGRCVAFGGRTLGADPAKYLNSPETPVFSKGRVLYGLDMARGAIASAREAIVVEGYTDVVLLSQAGIENVVATLGTALTDAHVKLLGPLSGHVVMCFDNDEAGLRAADRAVETALRHRTEVKVAIMPEGQDPADFVTGRGADALGPLLQSALEALEFKWNRTVKACSRAGRQGQREAVEAFVLFVARAALAGGIDPLDQGLLAGRLSELLSLPARTVYELLARAKAAAARETSSSASDTSELSAYEVSIRGCPPGLVSAIEELFGLALSAPKCFGDMQAGLAAGAEHAETWRRLYGILASLVEQRGSYVKADVVRSCEDGSVCELVSRAAARVASQAAYPEACRAVCQRVLSEVELFQIGTLRGRLRQAARSKEDQKQLFDSIHAAAKRQSGVLGIEQRSGVLP